MFKKATYLMVVSSLISASCLANTKTPATVNFTGEVTAPTCTVIAEDKTVALTLPDVTTKQISTTTNYFSNKAEIMLVSCPFGYNKVRLERATSTGEPTSNAMRIKPEGGTGQGLNIRLNAGPRGGTQPVDLTGAAISNITSAIYPDGTSIFEVQANISKDIDGELAGVGDYSTTITLEFNWG